MTVKTDKHKRKALSVMPTPLLWTRPDILFDGTEVLGAKPIHEAMAQRGSQPAMPDQNSRKLWKKDADPSTHYTPADLAESWGYSVYTIRRAFKDDPGTLKITQPNPRKRGYTTITIPQDVANRMYEKLKRGHR